jgi:hypothetical protein
MSDPASWQDGNAQYLSAAIAWLRALLQRRGGHPQASLATPPPQPEARPGQPQKSFWRPLMRRTPAQPLASEPVVLLPPGQASSADKSVAQAAADMADAAAHMTPPPALMVLTQCLGLLPFEQDVLLLCAAMELDTRIAALCAHAQGEPNRSYPTFALALTLFDDPSWDALSPERPLRYWRLIEITQPGGMPLTVSPLRSDERIVNYLKGVNYLDDRLAPLLSPMAVPGTIEEEPASQRMAAETIIGRLRQAKPGQNLPVVQLLGDDTPSKHLVAGLVSGSLNLRPYRLHSHLLPTQAGDLETFARLWQRESLLLPLALYLDTPQEAESEGSQRTQTAALNRLLARLNGVVFLDTRDIFGQACRNPD